MPAYRDDHQAAIDRAEALESEIEAYRTEHNADKVQIAELEDKVRTLRAAVAREGIAVEQLPSKASGVLMLGLLALFFCNVMGPFAWVAGNRELARIDAGLADPSKRGTVQAGRVLGIVATVGLALTALVMGAGLLASVSG
jgi:hypothetical protein